MAMHRHPDELDGTWEWERAQWVIDPNPDQQKAIAKVEKRYRRMLILRRILIVLWITGCIALIGWGVTRDDIALIAGGVGLALVVKYFRDVIE